MNRAIVTGATGFIGKLLVERLSQNGVKVVAVVRKLNEKSKALLKFKNVEIVECDICNIMHLKRYITKNTTDVFFHLAWEGTTGESRSDYNIQLSNIETTVNSLILADEIGCKKFVGVGSLMEYEVNYLMETNKQLAPNNIYSIAKYTAHVMTKARSSSLGVDYVWTYITNAYGEDEISSRFFNTTIKKMLNKEKLDFTFADNLYDFVHVEDVANALYLIGKHGKNGSNYCIGSGIPRVLKEYVIEMRNFIDKDLALNFGKINSPMIYLDKDVYSIEKTEIDTGYKPNISFEEGLRRVVNTLKHKEERNGKI